MAQSGYAPIQLYFSTISGHVPAAGDLVSGELAFNIPDGAVYYKNLSNTVTKLAGLSGYSGYSGISGYSGFSGISGYSGFSGISGYSGFSGISGYSGFSGISGYSGFSGFSGATGPTGTGTSGYSGFSGYSGTAGSSILTTANNFTNTNTFATTVSIGSTSTPGTLYVKGGNSNNLLVDNGGQQFTTVSLYNNGTEKGQLYWDQTNTIMVFGTDVAAPLLFKTNGTEHARVTPTGGFSVGTASDPGIGNVLVSGTVTASNHIGAGTGLTGTASALSIGGNAATATNATNATYASNPSSGGSFITSSNIGSQSVNYANSAGSVPATSCVYNSAQYEQFITASAYVYNLNYDVPTNYVQTGMRSYFEGCCFGYYIYAHSYSLRSR